MDFQYLLDILLRRKWLIALSVIVPAVAIFLYISSLDREYKSVSLISTGIVGTGFNPDETRSYVQEKILNINFGNLLQKIQGPSMKRLLAYDMLIHDLKGEVKAFRTIDEEDEITYSDEAIQKLISELEVLADTLDAKPLADIDKERMFKDLAKALEYDEESITNNLAVYKLGETEYIATEYKSEDAFLSAYLINTLIERFIELNRSEQQSEYSDEYKFAQKVEKERKAVVDSFKYQLNNYRRDRNVVDLETQSNKIVESISKLEEARAEEESRLRASEGAIARLNRYLGESDQTIVEFNQVLFNEEIARLRNRLNSLNDQYYQSGDKKLLAEIARIETDVAAKIKATVENESIDEELEGDGLLKTYRQQKVDFEIDKIQAKNRLESINASLSVLRGRKTGLVKDNTEIARLETDLYSAEEDYEKAKLELSEKKKVFDKSYQPLEIVETAQVADKPESSKRMLFTAFGGVLGGGFCTVLLLLLAFLDTSLNSAHQFKKFAKLPLMGTLNELRGTDIDLNEIFSSNGKNQDLINFKESIRNIRYHMEESGGRTFLFTSTKEQSGKTFLMITLAYALTLKKKKVLLIDTNFKNNTLTQMSEKARRKNLLTTKLIGKNKLGEDFESKKGIGTKFSIDHVDIIGNRGGYSSPSEIFAGKDFQQFVEELSQSYDYIFLEGASLNKYADTRELIEYADKVITVFSAESTINEADKDSIDFLNNLNGKVMGAILNKMELSNMN